MRIYVSGFRGLRDKKLKMLEEAQRLCKEKFGVDTEVNVLISFYAMKDIKNREILDKVAEEFVSRIKEDRNE